MRITGTHIYTLLRCAHAVTLDLHEDRSKRRAITEAEEFVRKRGRDWEDEFVAGLGYAEPAYERGDFDAGAAQTEAFLRAGVPGVSQGILLGERRLGIPDLLRREDGASAFGDHHYVVGDIKSSARPRSDQVLQVAFYSRMLAALQGRAPEYGYLILKDGREERFVLAEFEAVIEEVEARALQLLDAPDSTPFFGPGCHKCHWSEVCLPALRDADDLSLLQGMTRGLRTILQRNGLSTAASLEGMAIEPTARRTHLEPTLLRQLKKAAQARAGQAPLVQQRGKHHEVGDAAVLHHLFDHYSERLLFVGLQYPAHSGGAFEGVCPPRAEAELAAFERLLGAVPRSARLLHYGPALPRWYAERARHAGRDRTAAVEGRFIDLARRVRGAAVFQGPVFSLADHVRYGLGVDPHRDGEADAAAMWAARPEGEAWLLQKGRSDLLDLCRLAELACGAAVGSEADA